MTKLPSGIDDIADLLANAAKDAEKSTKLSSVFQNKRLDATQTRSTGLLYLDYLMGGGIPSGKIVGISSEEHLGKSALAAEMSNEQLLDGGAAVYFDGEGTQDPLFLQKRGIDFQKFRGKRNKAGQLNPGQRDYVWFYQPHTGQQFQKYIHTFCSALPECRDLRKPPLLYLLDSAMSVVSDAMAEDIESNKTAMHAKMYSEILPVINYSLLKTGASMVFTNQLRADVGKGFSGMGDATYEPGGKALQFYSSCRIRLTKSKPKTGSGDDHPFLDGFVPDLKPKAGGVWEEMHDGSDKNVIDKSIFVSFKTIKNKFYTPFKVGYYRIFFEENGETGSGFCPVFDTFSTLHELGLIVKGKNKQTYRLNLNDDVRKIGDLLPAEFDYYTLKKHVRALDRRKLRMDLRALLLDSGWAYDGTEVVTDYDGEESVNMATGEILEQPKPLFTKPKQGLL